MHYDCTQPKELQIFQSKSLCSKNIECEEDMGKTMTLVQKPFSSKLSGYSCSIRRSSYYYRCGVWAHLKTAHIPEVMRIVDVPVAECRDMINRQTYRQPQGSKIFKLKINQPTFIQIQERGELKIENDAVRCEGETVHLAGGIQHNVLLSSDFEIILKEETFVEAEDRIEVESDHISLPCSPEQLGCETGLKTFIWNRPTTTCQLMVLKNFRPRKTRKSFLVDHQQKILVNQTGQVTVSGCHFKLMATNHPQLFIMDASQSVNLPFIRPTEVDVNLFAAMDRNYLGYQLEKKIYDQRLEANQRFCLNHQQEIPTGEPVRISDAEGFGINMGDTYLTFKCTQRNSTIREDANCYTDIPIEPSGYVNPVNRLFTQHSTKVSCNRRFPLIVETNEAWVELLPHLKVRPAPKVKSVQKESQPIFEDFDQGGIYTSRELEEWTHLHSFPAYQKALLTSFSYGSCANTGNCKIQSTDTGIDAYDLQRLVPEIEDSVNLWKQFKNWLHLYGDLLAFLALTIIGIKLLSDILVICIAMIQAGPAAAAVLCCQIFLYNRSVYNKMMRKHKTRKPSDHHEMQPQDNRF